MNNSIEICVHLLRLVWQHLPIKIFGALLMDLYLRTALITQPLPIRPTMKIRLNTTGTAIATK